MQPSYYPTLREANVERAKIWGASGKIDLCWRLNEIAGETGEVCNLLKKFQREDVGEPGSRATNAQLAEELADVLICLDLYAMALEQEFVDEIIPDMELGATLNGLLPTDDYNRMGLRLFWHVGSLADLFFEHTEAGNIEVEDFINDTETSLAAAATLVSAIAARRLIDLNAAVAEKFNKTSTAVGLPVFMVTTRNV